MLRWPKTEAFALRCGSPIYLEAPSGPDTPSLFENTLLLVDRSQPGRGGPWWPKLYRSSSSARRPYSIIQSRSSCLVASSFAVLSSSSPSLHVVPWARLDSDPLSSSRSPPGPCFRRLAQPELFCNVLLFGGRVIPRCSVPEHKRDSKVRGTHTTRQPIEMIIRHFAKSEMCTLRPIIRSPTARMAFPKGALHMRFER